MLCPRKHENVVKEKKRKNKNNRVALKQLEIPKRTECISKLPILSVKKYYDANYIILNSLFA